MAWVCQGPSQNRTQKKKRGWPWARGAPQYLGFPYNISETSGASDFNFGAQLGFAKAYHKITHKKVGVPSARGAPQTLGVSLQYLHNG